MHTTCRQERSIVFFSLSHSQTTKHCRTKGINSIKKIQYERNGMVMIDREHKEGGEKKKGKLWCRGKKKMRCWQKNNLMDKHLWVRGTMGNIYCRITHFSLALPVNLRGQLRSRKEEWDPLGKGQNGDNPERWVLRFHLLYLCCFLSLFNLEKWILV